MIIRTRRWLTSSDGAADARRLMARLHREEGGNIIVLYVAAALLLVGMLWAIIGTGARVVQKETIQSSADAAAFSAAVIKAKGLNIIAFCNLVMALLLAIIMLLRLIKYAMIVFMGLCTLSCALTEFGGGELCPFLPTATQLEQQFSRLVDQLEPRIMDAMRGLADVQDGVNDTFQALALAEGIRVGMHGAYQKNMGHGMLITVTWPLPIGDDFYLPVERDTWDKMCQEAAATFDRLTELTLQKIGLGAVAGIVGGAIGGMFNALRTVLCPDDTSAASSGSASSMIDTTSNVTDCHHCANPSSSETVQTATWHCERVIRDDHGRITGYAPAGDCQTSGVSDAWCDPSNNSITSCQDSSGNGGEHRLSSFILCNIKSHEKANLGSDVSGNKPLPMKMKDKWQDHSQVRAFTLLTDAAMDDRRQSVNVASRNKGSRPFLNQMLGMAQAEFYHFNGPTADDLWHMDWRARLVRFYFFSPDGNTGGTPGADTILAKIGDFLLNDAGAALKDQFMVH
jgi:hypothetical protein